MDKLMTMVADALLEIKDAAINIKSEADYDAFKLKYDASLEGENDNILESAMLNFALSYKFDLELIDEQLNEILPYVCEKLGMKCEPDENEPTDYLIHLY